MKILTLVHIFLSYIFSIILIFPCLFLFPGANFGSLITRMVFIFLILFLGTSFSASIIKRQILDYSDYKEVLLFSVFLAILFLLFIILGNEGLPSKYYIQNPIKLLPTIIMILPYFLASFIFLKPKRKNRIK